MRKMIDRGLRVGKQATLGLATRLGLHERVTNSRWRQERLLVLCYHGASLDDEHEWNPALYVTASFLRRRLALLKRGHYNVLPLGEAVARLYAHNLPPRAVALTFDDGYHDFCELAWPILREFELPATVYLSTTRCDYGLPVFNLAVPLMLWRRRGTVCDARHLGVGWLDLRTTRSRDAAWGKIKGLATRANVQRKHQIARDVSDAIKGDYDEITRRRIVTIMRPGEVTRLSGEGVDFQLHTHRHRTPRDREEFRQEIVPNRQRIAELTGRTADHFCYPSGVYAPEFVEWLREESVVSATTCDPGIAASNHEPLLLPRLVDHPGLSASEFEAWLAGVPSLFARKAAAHRPRRARLGTARALRTD